MIIREKNKKNALNERSTATISLDEGIYHLYTFSLMEFVAVDTIGKLHLTTT